MKRLFISDIHPNRERNDDLARFLAAQSRERDLYFLGDCLVFPSLSYRGIEGTYLRGNHELCLQGLPEYALLDAGKTLLIHGHNAQVRNLPGLRQLVDVLDVGAGLWDSCFSARKWQFTDPEPVYRDLSDWWHDAWPEEASRLAKLCKWIHRRFTGVQTVLMGHTHRRYHILHDGIEFINCGAGWAGDHVMQDGNRFRYGAFGVVEG